MRGIIRLGVLFGWAVLVFTAGGLAVRSGAGQVTTGGLELLALAVGVAAVMLTPAWGRSIRADRERERV